MDQIGSKWIKMDQNGSKRIKLDQIGFLMKQSLKYISDFKLYLLARVLAKALKMLFPLFPGSLVKFSTFSTFLISDEIIIEIYHQIFNIFDQIESDLSKMDQNGSNWIKMDQNGSNLIKLDF